MSERNGRFFTFYSHKGGVGRSTVLANVAWILACNGLKVLVVDLDVEAPGIEYFFPEQLDQGDQLGQGTPGRAATSAGLLDLAARYLREVGRMSWRANLDSIAAEVVRDLDEGYIVSNAATGTGEGRVDLMVAGNSGVDYTQLTVESNWSALYEKADPKPGTDRSPFLGRLREVLRRDYHYILIDSRTGTGILPQISTLTMADEVVACFGMSKQGMKGTEEFLKLVRKMDGKKKIFPVPTRVERSDAGRLSAARHGYRTTFNDFAITAVGGSPELYWSAVEIPYQSSWALEEMPAPLAPSADPVIRGCMALTRHLTGRTDLVAPSTKLVDDRLTHLRNTALREPLKAYACVLIAFAEDARDWAVWLAHQVRRRGFAVELLAAEQLTEAESVDLHRRVRVESSDDYCVLIPLTWGFVNSTAGAGKRIVAAELERLTTTGAARLLPLVVAGSRQTTPFVDQSLLLDGKQVALSGTRLPGRGSVAARSVIENLLGSPTPQAAQLRASDRSGLGGGEAAGEAEEPAFPGVAPTSEQARLNQVAIDRAHLDNDDAGLVAALLDAGQTALREDRVDDARAYFDQVQRQTRDARQDTPAKWLGQARLLAGQADVARRTQDWQQALDLVATAEQHLVPLRDGQAVPGGQAVSRERVARVRWWALSIRARVLAPNPGSEFDAAVRQLRVLALEMTGDGEPTDSLLELAQILGQARPADARRHAGLWRDVLNRAERSVRDERSARGDVGKAKFKVGMAQLFQYENRPRKEVRALYHEAVQLTGPGRDSAVDALETQYDARLWLARDARQDGDWDGAEKEGRAAIKAAEQHEPPRPDLMVTGRFFLGQLLESRAAIDGVAAAEHTRKSKIYYAQAVQVGRDRSLRGIREFAAAFTQVMDELHNDDGSGLLASEGIEGGPQQAVDDAIRALWVKAALDEVDDVVEQIRTWLLRRSDPERLRVRIGEVLGSPADAKRVLAVVHLEETEQAETGQAE